MYKITLICTRHRKLGKCNSNELYKIIEQINPDIIFEEIPPRFFDEFYIEKRRSNLESEAVSKYKETYTIQHIPVDSDDIPSESFFKDFENVSKKIENLLDDYGLIYRNSIDINKCYTERYGFKYLNSKHSITINEKIYAAIEFGLQKINNNKLSQTFKLWKEINEKRENKMLKNIYEYSKNHKYDKAIFMIGAAHRKSIIQKILKLEKEEDLKLNWTFNL